MLQISYYKMSRYFHKFILMIYTVVITSCTPKPEIFISNTLELGLNNRYTDYVYKLNASIHGDTTALKDFLKYDKIYDGAAYEHGWVLIELMRKIGDNSFSNALKQMDEKQLNNINIYFKGGMDIHKKSNDIQNCYPKSFDILSL